jgi:hypothetical protein
LCMEAQVLIQQRPRLAHSGQREIAACVSQPVLRRPRLWHVRRHRPLCPGPGFPRRGS